MTKVDDEVRKRPWMPILLVLLPLWLALSAAGGLWLKTRKDARLADEQRSLYARSVSPEIVADDLGKFLGIIGERNTSGDAARQGLAAVVAMTEGTLGPSNTGYRVRRLEGPLGQPLLHVRLPGARSGRPPVWVLTTLDSPPGSVGAEANASGLAATLAAARAVAGDRPAADLHFLFLPHAHDPAAPQAETAAAALRAIREEDPPAVVWWVEAMGRGETLWLHGAAAAGVGPATFEGLASADPSPLAGAAARLLERGGSLPLVRVSTAMEAAESPADAPAPDPATVAAAAGRLVELIRRSSGN